MRERRLLLLQPICSAAPESHLVQDVLRIDADLRREPALLMGVRSLLVLGHKLRHAHDQALQLVGSLRDFADLFLDDPRLINLDRKVERVHILQRRLGFRVATVAQSDGSLAGRIHFQQGPRCGHGIGLVLLVALQRLAQPGGLQRDRPALCSTIGTPA